MDKFTFKPIPEKVTKAVNPSLNFASDIPPDCKAYVFYVPGIIDYEDLKKSLLEFGGKTGKNIFVGAWELKAEAYQDVLKYFKISESPAVIVSAAPELSTSKDKKNTPVAAFARIDNSRLLNDKGNAVKTINETCNLFLRGDVQSALMNANVDEFKSSFNFYLGKIKSGISDFLKDHSVTFDVLKGQIIIAPSPPPEDKDKAGKAAKA